MSATLEQDLIAKLRLLRPEQLAEVKGLVDRLATEPEVERLRADIRAGLESGPSTALDMAEVRALGRRLRESAARGDSP